MTFRINISAGEFFELIRPAALIFSAIVSALVLASARRRFAWYQSSLWAISTFFLPFVVLPIYWLRLVLGRSKAFSKSSATARLIIPVLYFAILLLAILIYLSRDERTVDAHLARAAQAKVSNDRSTAIREYEDAIALEDDAHIHKLLAIELSEDGRWVEAISEFRLAERGGERDDLIHFWLGQLLERLSLQGQAGLEYKAFVTSTLCTDALPDVRCDEAKQKVADMQK